MLRSALRTGQSVALDSVHALVVVVLAAIVPLAYSSPVDATWFPGIYDAADYDEVVSLLLETSGAADRGRIVASEAMIAIGSVVEHGCRAVGVANFLLIRPRSPPINAIVVVLTSHSTLSSPPSYQVRAPIIGALNSPSPALGTFQDRKLHDARFH